MSPIYAMLIGALALTAYPAAAQAAVVGLQSAVEEALSHSPEIKEAEERLAELRYQKYGVVSTLLPKIDFTAGASQRKDAVANRTSGSVPFGGNSYNLYSLALKGEQSILSWGTFAALRYAQLQREIGDAGLQAARRDLTQRTISAFYRTVMNDNLLRILDEQEKVVTEILGIAQRRAGLGGKRIDVLQVRTQLALLKPKIEKARNELASASAELASLMGQAEASSLTIKGRLPAVSVKELEKLLNLQAFDIPELTSVRLRREQNASERAVSLGKALPSVKLLGDYSFLNYTKADVMDPASNSWSVQLLLSVPLFSGLSSVYERKALNSREAQLQLEESGITKATALKQIQSRKGMESAEASLASAEEAAKLARESLNEARREYRFGIMDFLQFLQVESQFFEATNSLLRLRFDAIMAASDYFAASGQPMGSLVEYLAREEKKE